jgi:hypothetical protein
MANKHITHLEESVIDGGSKGIKYSISLLHTVFNTLHGNVNKPPKIGIKFDGSPAIIAGWLDGKFFVGTKAVFNKEPKINYTNIDIDTNHPDSGLNSKLKQALKFLSGVIKSGIHQGDFLYSKEDIKIEVIDDVSYLTFTPNTITYAIPSDSELGRRIFSTEMGIVFHTKYQSLNGEHSHHDVDIKQFNQTKDVWSITDVIDDVSGRVTLTSQESILFRELLNNIIYKYRTVRPGFFDEVASNNALVTILKTYINSNIKKSVDLRSMKNVVLDFGHYIDQKFEHLKKSYKTQKKIGSVHNEKELLHRVIEGHLESFTVLFEIHNLMTQAKEIIISKFNALDHMKTFIHDGENYKVANPEGFVVSDHIGNVVKFVDRLEFSAANFKKNGK